VVDQGRRHHPAACAVDPTSSGIATVRCCAWVRNIALSLPPHT
jgi:hypothetical protein